MDLFGASVAPIVAFFLLGELAVLVTLIVAIILARLHKGSIHHYLVLIAFLSDSLLFKPLMLSRASSAWGSWPWDGTRIAPHLLVSIVAAVLGVLAVVLGFRYRVKKGSKMFLPPKGKLHRTIGWLFLVLWLLTFTVGIVIFLETYFP